MKDFDEYKNKMKYPVEKEFTTVYGYSSGKVVFSMPAVGYYDLSKVERPGANTIEKVIDKETFMSNRKAYGAETARLEEEFKRDLFRDYGVEDNPKREKAYAYAWERGHSGGLEEVYNVFHDLVELID